MTKEEMIDDFEERQMIVQARLEAYKKVIDSVRRLYESSERNMKEAKLAMAKAGDSSAVSPKLKQKALQAQAESDVYCEVIMSVGKTAKDCKEAMMRDVREFNKVLDGMIESEELGKILNKHPDQNALQCVALGNVF